jgi:excisionase family DNA binding protein
MSEMRISFPEEVVESIAERVAARVLATMASSSSSPWMTADEAAKYLRCSESRVRKLTSLGDLPRHRDGGRVLYRRDELDAFVARGGASTGR